MRVAERLNGCEHGGGEPRGGGSPFGSGTMGGGPLLQVVSVSLGCPRRDHQVILSVGGARVFIRRIGTGGDLRLAARIIRELDGQVSAIGLGGINADLRLGNRRYPLPEGRWLRQQARRTPAYDGSGWKEFVEPALLHRLSRETGLEGRVVLVSSVLDRYHLARALRQLGARVLVGDAFFALKLPLIFPSVESFHPFALASLPLLRRVPIRFLYGPGQGGCRVCPPWFLPLLRGVDALAGDFHLMKRCLPDDLQGRMIIASTLTADEEAELLRRGAGRVLSITPSVAGRVFGANVWEAAARAVTGRLEGALVAEECLELLEAVGEARLVSCGTR